MTYQDRVCEYIDLWAELDQLDALNRPTEQQRERFSKLCRVAADMITEDKKRTVASKKSMVGSGPDNDRLAMEAIDDITYKVKRIRYVKIGHGADQLGELSMAFWGLSGDLAERYASKRAENNPGS